MASLYQERGRFVIQYVWQNDNRRKLRLGKVSKSYAENFKVKFERLIAELRNSGHKFLGYETETWLAGLTNEMAKKLARHGLIPERKSVPSLGEMIDRWADVQSRNKSSTQRAGLSIRNDLLEFFDANISIGQITAEDAKAFCDSLRKRPLAEATVQRRTGRCKNIFGIAVEEGHIPSNPFAGLQSSYYRNPERLYYLDRQMSDQILRACPNVEWKLIFAFARFAGLRCPSEFAPLKWNDVDWERSVITVTSPKTEAYPGKGKRDIPIFPEIRPHLEALAQSNDGAGPFVVKLLGGQPRSLYGRFETIIKHAGLKKWPRLFQNLRSSFETDLVKCGYPEPLMLRLLGHDRREFTDHYFQFTDDMFHLAAKLGSQSTASFSSELQKLHAGQSGSSGL